MISYATKRDCHLMIVPAWYARGDNLLDERRRAWAETADSAMPKMAMSRRAAVPNAEDSAANKRIFDLWRACRTLEETAEEASSSQSNVDRTISQFGNLVVLGRSDLAATEHAVDFDPPICNVWKHYEKMPGVVTSGARGPACLTTCRTSTQSRFRSFSHVSSPMCP